ncbi:MAG: SDR family oxidoreductase [Candidatus Sericytochromatia bacterium]|uniref:SDR family oxidoreductase n=1 Tax=Candidatus Tanganyikabacteria bacterium TaxID=2961651 RepID=A0A937X3F7_9BACT|nr:SDR family oxidoreductase [Candidatus Tanganyikabacteria bacterium]
MDLKDKPILVTGAGIRVGRAIALAAASAGAPVGVHYNRSSAPAEDLVAAIKEKGGQAVAVQADLAVHADAARAVDAAADALGGLYGVVNSASVFYRTPLGEITDEHWRDNLDVNLLAPWWVSRAAIPHFRRRGTGRIVNIVDWAGEKPYTGYLPYAVSKAGLICMTKALAKELAPDVTVNAVAPGPMLPPEDMDEEDKARVAGRIPLKRWGKPEDVAAAAMFFLAATDFSTGSILHVDGGSILA